MPEAKWLTSANMVDQCEELGKWLLVATRGGKAFCEKNPRAPYLTDYADCVTEIQLSSLGSIDQAYENLKNVEAGEWLLTVPPVKECTEEVHLPFGHRLRMDFDLKDSEFDELKAPSWAHECNLCQAMTNLEQLNVGLTADELVSKAPGDVKSCFAWLHARWLAALCETVRDDVCSHIRPYFEAYDPIEAIFPSHAKSHEHVWTTACKYLHTMQANMDYTNNDLERAKATPAYFVCDILEVEFTYQSPSDLKAVYERISSLTWIDDGIRLVQTANQFHDHHVGSKGEGYRDLKVWLAVYTRAGPFIIEVRLHLAAFHEHHGRTGTAFQCFKGKFENEGEPRKHWFKLVGRIQALREAEAQGDPHLLSEAIEEARTAGCTHDRLCKAMKILQKQKSTRAWQARQDELRAEHQDAFHQKQVAVAAANKAHFCHECALTNCCQ